jgi:hypothetical protein
MTTLKVTHHSEAEGYQNAAEPNVDDLVNHEESAKFLGISSGYLANLRSMRVGLNGSSTPIPYVKLGSKVMYERRVLEAVRNSILTRFDYE